MTDLPLHPMLVHFPIAAALGALVLYILAALWPRPTLGRAAAVTALVAAVSAIAASQVGDGAYEQVEMLWKAVPASALGAHAEAGERAMYALVGLGLAGALAWWATGGHSRRWVLAGLAVLHAGAMAQVVYTGGLGAELVYVHGAAIEPLKGMRDYRRLRIEGRRRQMLGDQPRPERGGMDVPVAPQTEQSTTAEPGGDMAPAPQGELPSELRDPAQGNPMPPRGPQWGKRPGDRGAMGALGREAEAEAEQRRLEHERRRAEREQRRNEKK